jgi:hypothetical protein
MELGHLSFLLLLGFRRMAYPIHAPSNLTALPSSRRPHEHGQGSRCRLRDRVRRSRHAHAQRRAGRVAPLRGHEYLTAVVTSSLCRPLSRVRQRRSFPDSQGSTRCLSREPGRGVTAALSKKRGVGLELAFDFARLSLQQTFTRPSVSAVGIPARSRGAGVELVSARRLVEPPRERRPGFQPRPSSLRDGTGPRRKEGPPITS